MFIEFIFLIKIVLLAMKGGRECCFGSVNFVFVLLNMLWIS